MVQTTFNENERKMITGRTKSRREQVRKYVTQKEEHGSKNLGFT
jgi:hypothetical protein